MKIRKAKLARRFINGVDMVKDGVPIGSEYYVDLDSASKRIIGHKTAIGVEEIGECTIAAVDGGQITGLFPLDLLDVEEEEPCSLDPEIERRLTAFKPVF